MKQETGIGTFSDAGDKSSTGEKLLTLSNLLSLSRVALMVPFVVLMYSTIPNARLLACGVILIAIVTDKLDGVFARKFHQITEWGRIIDPVSDKIAIGTVAVVLLLKGELPFWFLFFILVRDAVIFVGGMYIKSKRAMVLPSNEVGKWAVTVIALTLVLVLLEFSSPITDISMVGSVIMMLWSFVLYLRRFIRVVRYGTI